MVQGSDVAPDVFNGSGHTITIPGLGTFAPGETISTPASVPTAATPTAGGVPVITPGAALVLANNKNAIFNRDSIGWNIRANFGFDLASNTAYGPLIGHMDFNGDLGNGWTVRAAITLMSTPAI